MKPATTPSVARWLVQATDQTKGLLLEKGRLHPSPPTLVPGSCTDIGATEDDFRAKPGNFLGCCTAGPHRFMRKYASIWAYFWRTALGHSHIDAYFQSVALRAAGIALPARQPRAERLGRRDHRGRDPLGAARGPACL